MAGQATDDVQSKLSRPHWLMAGKATDDVQSKLSRPHGQAMLHIIQSMQNALLGGKISAQTRREDFNVD